MTFEDKYGLEPRVGDRVRRKIWHDRRAVWSAALTSERERIIALVRDNRGKCVSDASCEALVEEIRRTYE
jgi:hypothetical protein